MQSGAAAWAPDGEVLASMTGHSVVIYRCTASAKKEKKEKKEKMEEKDEKPAVDGATTSSKRRRKGAS